MHLIAYSDTRMQYPIRINSCKAGALSSQRVTTPATGSDTTSIISIPGCGASAQDWFDAPRALASVAFSFCCVMFVLWDSGRRWEHSICTICSVTFCRRTDHIICTICSVTFRRCRDHSLCTTCSVTFCRRRDQRLQISGGPLGETLGLVSDKLSVSHANRFSCNPIVAGVQKTLVR